MIKYILLCIIFPSLLSAHQADISSTMIVERNDGTYMVELRTALTAFEYAVHAHYGEFTYDSPEAFKNLVVKHVTENVSIYVDDNYISLENGTVKLGHETYVFFELNGIPKSFESISIQNSSFKDIHRNQSALIILKKGVVKEQFVLSEKNDHQISFQIFNSKFIPQIQNSITTKSNLSIVDSIPLTWIYILILICIFIFLVKKTPEFSS